MTIARITFELIDEKDYTVIHRKVYNPHTEQRLVDHLAEIAHIHSFEAKRELLRRLEPEKQRDGD